MTSPTIVIKAGREKPIIQQHPWIFSGAIDEVKGDPTPGDIVTVTDKKGRFLARGYWNPRSQIQVRILTWQDEPIDEAWWRKMLKRAIEGRKERYIYQDGKIPFRMINAENDYIPGLIVDFYGNFDHAWLVIQALTFWIDQEKEFISRTLAELVSEAFYQVKGVYERSDVDVRGKEGLKQVTGVLLGEPPPPRVEVQNISPNLVYTVDIINGHKTGYYLDQADSRHELFRIVSDVRSDHVPSILNLFSYTGGFGMFANAAGAGHIVNVDSSHDVLELAEINMGGNEHPNYKDWEFIQADVFELLRDYASEGKQFDVVVLDPPKFAHNAGQVEKAARGYKDINLNAFKCVKPGGYLMTFSCSGAISADLFQKIVFGALADSGRQAQILKHLGPGDDHPVALTFPEGAYLKGLLLRVY